MSSEFKLGNKKKLILANSFIVLISFCVILIYLKVRIIKDVINLFIGSCIFAYILKPVRNKLNKKFNWSNQKSSGVLFVVVIVLLLGIIFSVIPILYNEFNNISLIAEKIIDGFNNIKENEFLKNSEIAAFIYDKIQNAFLEFFESSSVELGVNIIKISDSFLSLAVVPIIAYYILADSTKISRKLLLIVPRKNRILIKEIISDIDSMLGKYILGQISLSVLIAILTFVGMLILNVKFAIGLSIINGIFNIIPYFGPIFGAIPIVFVAFLDSNIKGIYTLIFIIIIQQIEGNVLCPKITGESTDIHPIVIILALIAGEKIGGFFWMVLSVPIVVILKVTYDDINKYLF